MEKTNVKVRKWGNSFGVILPKSIVDKQDIKDGMEIEIIVETKNKTKVKDVFGILKGKLKRPEKSTQEIMDEIDEELWGIKR